MLKLTSSYILTWFIELMEKIHKTELYFYQKLGELFYAISASDQLVKEEEYKALVQIVEKEWKSESDYDNEFNTDAANQISIVFNWFDYERMDSEECYKNFVNFYLEHKTLFTEKKKSLILKTAQTITDALGGTNKSELIMITKLRLLFEKE